MGRFRLYGFRTRTYGAEALPILQCESINRSGVHTPYMYSICMLDMTLSRPMLATLQAEVLSPSSSMFHRFGLGYALSVRSGASRKSCVRAIVVANLRLCLLPKSS